MSRKLAFRRKIAYLIAIGLLLPVLYWLGHPEAASTEDAQGSPGGKLAQIRTEQKLSSAQLGQIDPTSETIKLATFGLRPIAANILWAKAINYKMKKDWTNLAEFAARIRHRGGVSVYGGNVSVREPSFE